jgi:hypothetical protein
MKTATLKIFLLLFSAIIFSNSVPAQDGEKGMANCGGLGQPPCNTWEERPCTKKEKFPTCKCRAGLKEKSKLFGRAICMFPEDERHGNPSVDFDVCGDLNQRPCRKKERTPACYDGLTINKNKCVRPTECGGIDQPPCEVSRKNPVTDFLLPLRTEFSNGRFVPDSLAINLLSSSREKRKYPFLVTFF